MKRTPLPITPLHATYIYRNRKFKNKLYYINQQ